MSNDIIVDAKGAKLGWIVLAGILGATATIYFENLSTSSKAYTNDKIAPLERRVYALEFANKANERELENLKRELTNK